MASRMRFRAGGKPLLRRRINFALKTIGAGVGYAALIEPHLLETTQVEIPIKDMPSSLEGYRIAHLTDIHYNFVSGKNYLERVIERTIQLDPDLVALTGDFITHNPQSIEKCMKILAELNPPDGCWVVRGNHDYRIPLQKLREVTESHGFHLLENEGRTIVPQRHRYHYSKNQKKEGYLNIAGVGDLWEGECLPGKSLEHTTKGYPTILLAHHGQAANLLTKDHRVDIILSGHTHGGQIRTLGREFSLFTSGDQQYVKGLIQTPHAPVYISRGVGTSALRFRWNCRPEIALILLHGQ